MVDDENSIPIEVSQDNEILKGSNDYYFDASAVDDSGNGTIDNPYKYLTADRIKANANIHLANGEYNLDNKKVIEQVNFIGSDANETIIVYDGIAFEVWNTLTLTNLTMSGATIVNYVNLNATNTIFADGYGRNPDRYGNNFGGAIYCPYYSSDYTSCVNINNCTFSNNYAEYGGAIYMNGGSLDIIDTMFINNFAYNFGGAIASEYGTKITVSRSKFYNSYSMADAGGAVYARASTLKMSNVEIINSTATFGGAIASLDTVVSLNYLTAQNCSSRWDGGAIYHMYGNFSSMYGTFNNNSANNGGAIFVDNSTSFILRNNVFTNNHANLTAGAVYSICNTLKGAATVKQFNRFTGNRAFFKDDEYEISSINLTIGNGNYAMYKNNASEVIDLPSYYSLRDYNLVTVPKDQQSSGNCWAFTALSVLESAILKATGETFDLSEENMKNVIAQFSDYGWNMETNEGGYDGMSIGYLVSWLGPVNETDDVFDDHGTLSPVLDSIMHVQNVKFLKRDNYLDNDEIKRAIMQYGAVGTSMLYDNNFFRWEGYYCWYVDSSNHAVTIVGWDDNYSRDNFYGLPQDKGDGAWIVKNSWGPNWVDDGYFYVSYYDEKLAEPGRDNIAYTFILNDTIKYDRNYQYDIAGKTDFYYNGNDTLWYKNIFQAENNEFLAGISTYFEKVTNWTASVYVNSQIKAVIEGTSNPGYYTFDLGKLIPLVSGDEFEIEFKVSSSDVVSIPISEKISLNKLIYRPGISFISLDGENWDDLYNCSGSYGTHKYYSQVACIKAFTILNEINTTAFLDIVNDGELFNFTATVVDQYGNLLKYGNVTFNLSGEEFIVNIENGIAKLSHILNRTYNDVSVRFDEVGYISSANSTSIVISKEIIDMDVYISKYQHFVNMTVTVPYNINGTLNLIIANRSYRGNLINGNHTFNLILDNGCYDYDLYLDENFYYESHVNGNFTVDVKDTQIEFNELTVSDGKILVSVTLTDESGNPIPSQMLNFKLNGEEYSNYTDIEGKSFVLIDIPVGTNIVVVRYDGNADLMGSSINDTVIVRGSASINVSAEDIGYGELLVVNVQLPSDVTRRAIVTLGDESKYVTLKGGIGSVKFAGLAVGTHEIMVSYKGDAVYAKSSANATVCVNRGVADIGVTVHPASYGQSLTVDVQLPLDATGYAEVRIGNDIKALNLIDGAGSVEFNGLAIGTHTITVSYEGDANYLESYLNTTVKVNKPVPEIIVTADNINYGDVLTVEIQLPSDVTRRAIVSVDNVSKTVSLKDGAACVKFSGLAIGTHLVTVSYNGDAIYAKYCVNTTVKVNRGPADIHVTADTVSYGESVIVNVQLPFDVTRRATVTIGNESKLVSLRNGTGSVSFNGLAAGTHEICVSYAGDSIYLKSSLNTTVKVNKATPQIQITASDITHGDALTVEVQLPSDVTRRATVTIGNQTKYVSLKNGTGSVKFTGLDVGMHEVQVSYAGDANYKSCSNTTMIEVRS